MTAEEARKINQRQEDVDNSADILKRIRYAAERRETEIEVDGREMTHATERNLRELGYKLRRELHDDPAPECWFRKKRVWIVSWDEHFYEGPRNYQLPVQMLTRPNLTRRS